jgi:ABC-type transporter Mla MlaB component
MTDDRYHLLALSGDCSIKSAQAVADQLREALPRHKRLAIATAGITAADLTTAQLLLAARASAAANGAELALAEPVGAPLREFLAASGMASPAGTDFWTSTIPAGNTA